MKETGKKLVLSTLLFFVIALNLCISSFAEEKDNITANGIMVKTNEVYALNTQNIDELLEKAGSSYRSKYLSIFHGSKVSADSEYIDLCSGVGVVDAATNRILDYLYVTSSELDELIKMMNNGSLAKKYKVSEAILVEEAEGYAYYARFKKTGKTSITINSYEVADDKIISVTFPVTVLPNEITTKTVKLKEGDTFRLTSTEIDKLIAVEGLDVLTFNRNDSFEAYTPETATYNSKLIELGYAYNYYKKSDYSDVSGTLWVKYDKISALIEAYNAGKTDYDPNVYGITFSAVPYTAKALNYGKGNIVIGEYIFLDGNMTCKVKVTIPYVIEEKSHTYIESVTKATVKKDGKVETVCKNCGKVAKSEKIYAASDIALSKSSYSYDGKTKKPSVVVKDRNGKTVSKDYYSVSYPTSVKKVGKYTVKITFKGRYSGNCDLSYTIVPKTTAVSKLSAGNKAFTLSWKKQSVEVTGYQIMYSPSKTFKTDNKTVTVKGNNTTQKTIKNLLAPKKYYVRIRTYKTVGKSNIYSEWSKTYYISTKSK